MGSPFEGGRGDVYFKEGDVYFKEGDVYFKEEMSILKRRCLF